VKDGPTRPVVAIVQARMGSTRLPGKSLAPVDGRTMLEVMLDRVGRTPVIDAVWVATTTAERDDAVAAAAARAGVPVFRGSEDDVLGRYAGAAAEAGAGTVVRLTADCPLIGPEAIEAVVGALREGGADIATNAPPAGRTWPDGLDAEAFSRDALDALDAATTDPGLREHVTLGFHRDPRWRVRTVDLDRDLGDVRITVDTQDDLDLVRSLLEELLARNPAFDLADVLAALERRDLLPERA
jgi:spore coat polysaccharide biosynthesis protein SpsF